MHTRALVQLCVHSRECRHLQQLGSYKYNHHQSTADSLRATRTTCRTHMHTCVIVYSWRSLYYRWRALKHHRRHMRMAYILCRRHVRMTGWARQRHRCTDIQPRCCYRMSILACTHQRQCVSRRHRLRTHIPRRLRTLDPHRRDALPIQHSYRYPHRLQVA